MLKLFQPYVSWRALWEVNKVLLRGRQLAEGPRVERFEKEFEKKFNVLHAVALNSGTSALELAYDLAEIQEGDEVITPVFTCTATNIPLARRKANIVFADIEKDLNISVEDVERKITGKTKVIVFVHFGGLNRGLQEILDLGHRKNIAVIEDAAQAVGSDFWGKADFAAMSFQAIKTLTTGDGGILFVKNEEDYQKAKRLRWFGYDRKLKQKLGDTDLHEAGYKYHMNDITAAIGLGNLHMVDTLIWHRKELLEIYRGYGLSGGIWLVGGISNNYQGLKAYMASHGVEIGQHHYRNDQYTIFGGRQALPIMDSIEGKYFFVPMHHGVSRRQAHRIGSLVMDFAKHYA